MLFFIPVHLLVASSMMTKSNLQGPDRPILRFLKEAGDLPDWKEPMILQVSYSADLSATYSLSRYLGTKQGERRSSKGIPWAVSGRTQPDGGISITKMPGTEKQTGYEKMAKATYKAAELLELRGLLRLPTLIQCSRTGHLNRVTFFVIPLAPDAFVSVDVSENLDSASIVNFR
jgi:hypothetical protein